MMHFYFLAHGIHELRRLWRHLALAFSLLYHPDLTSFTPLIRPVSSPQVQSTTLAPV
jgi:hypothetical protein